MIEEPELESSARAARPPARGVVAGIPIYPLLLAAAFVLAFLAGNSLQPVAVTRAFAVVLVATAALVLLATKIFRGPDRAGLAASLILFLAIAATDGRVALTLVIGVIAIWIDARRAHIPWILWAQLTRIGLVFSAALVLVVAFQAAGNWLSRQSIHIEDDWARVVPGPEATFPDIYFVLADGLGRTDVLYERYGLDSTTFLEGLEKMGFDVAAASRTNYMMTRLALASMLNGDYLDGLGIADGERVPPGWLERAIEDPAGMRLLERAGYETTVVTPGYEGIRVARASTVIDGVHLSEIEGVMLEGTAVDVALRGVWPTYVAESVRGRTLDALTLLRRLSRKDESRSPRFVMIHLPVPHFPFVFGPKCEEINGGVPNVFGSPEAGSAKTDAERELEISLTAEQSACVQRLLLDSLTQLVETNPTAVVLVFSDHGPDARLDWWRPNDDGMRERLANFVALYAPGHANLLPDNVTLVNILPRVLNAYLGTDLAIREDRTYFGLDRVTGSVRLVDVGS